MTTAVRMRDEREAVERRQCDALASRVGIVRVQLSESRQSRIEPGLPDAYYRWPSKRSTFWFEAKSETGKLTEAQHRFLLAELECGNLAVCGTATDFTTIVQLLSRGIPRYSILQRCREIVGVWASKGYRST